jgi:signal transduction protein with GAF and PtsI domain
MAPGLVRGLVDPDAEVALLLGVINLTATGPEVEPLAAKVARLITDTTETDVCFVHVLDDTEGSLTLAGATPPFDKQVGRVRLPIGSGVTGWVAEHRTPVVLPEGKASDPRYLSIPELRGADFTSMASIPMEIDPGGLVGVLNVHTVARREFTPRDVELLRVIGRLVAGALNQARLHRRLAARERMHEQFVEQVIATQEAERRRMAGDIHDGISQRLISLSYHLDAASHAAADGDGAEVAEQLAQARELLGLALDEARSAIGGAASAGAGRSRVGRWPGQPRAVHAADRDGGRPDRSPVARACGDRAVPDRPGVPAEHRQTRPRLVGHAALQRAG